LKSTRFAASAQEQDNKKFTKDILEDTRLEAIEHIWKHQAETIRWRDRKVKLKSIAPGHLVLRRVSNLDTIGKLQVKWEGPFLVSASSRPSSLRLKDMEGNDIPRPWNADELRKYHV
jgi:hypothetical protein